MKEAVWKRLLLMGLVAVTFIYIIALVGIIIFKSGLMPQPRFVQWVPFAFVGDLIAQRGGLDNVLKNVLGNFALFIPLGLLLPLYFKGLGTGRIALAGFLVSLVFELAQYVFAIGMADVDDLILNTLGACAGARVYYGYLQRRRPLRTMAASFLFLTAFGCCGVLAIVLYQPSLLLLMK